MQLLECNKEILSVLTKARETSIFIFILDVPMHQRVYKLTDAITALTSYYPNNLCRDRQKETLENLEYSDKPESGATSHDRGDHTHQGRYEHSDNDDDLFNIYANDHTKSRTILLPVFSSNSKTRMRKSTNSDDPIFSTIKGFSEFYDTEVENWGEAASDDVHRAVEVAFQKSLSEDNFKKLID